MVFQHCRVFGEGAVGDFDLAVRAVPHSAAVTGLVPGEPGIRDVDLACVVSITGHVGNSATHAAGRVLIELAAGDGDVTILVIDGSTTHVGAILLESGLGNRKMSLSGLSVGGIMPDSDGAAALFAVVICSERLVFLEDGSFANGQIAVFQGDGTAPGLSLIVCELRIATDGDRLVAARLHFVRQLDIDGAATPSFVGGLVARKGDVITDRDTVQQLESASGTGSLGVASEGRPVGDRHSCGGVVHSRHASESPFRLGEPFISALQHRPIGHNAIGPLCSFSVRLRPASFSHSHTGAAHDQHAGHGQAAESVHQVALFEHRLVAVDEVPNSSLGKLHNSISRICDVRPTTGVRCTGRLSGRETKNRCK